MPHPTLSVNETIRRHPEALLVLNHFGVDTCCGGAESLEEAARASGVPLETLIGALRKVVADAGQVTTEDAR